MDRRELPIAVFDSGLGGISVLKRICEALPEEKFIYFGDSANAPYGTKDPEWIVKRCDVIASDFISRGVKAIVVACNTATSAAAPYLREKYKDIPVIGLEPALKPAVLDGSDGAVVVMATPVTLSGEKFASLLDRYRDQREIIILPAPHLVDFVEQGIYGGDRVVGYLKEIASPYGGKKISSVVLGCTHFPFLKESIASVFGDVSFYDGATGTARETARRLAELDLLSEGGDGYIMMENSAEGDEIIDRAWELFDMEI